MDESPQTTISAEERSNFYRVAMERVADYAAFLMDPKGIILDWNHAAELMKGYTAEEIKGQFLGVLYTDKDQAEGHPQHNLVEAAKHGTFQEETWRKKKDGGLFWAHIELIAVHDETGRVKGYCKFTQDLTARKELEDRLRQAKEQTEHILEVAHAATWQWYPESGEAQISPSLIKALGYEPCEIGPAEKVWETLVHPDDLPALQQAVQSASQGPDGVPPVEFRLRHQNGEYRWFETQPNQSLQVADERSPLVVTGIMVNIHERKDAEQERERLLGQVAAERARALAILEQMPVPVVLANIPSGTVFHYNGEAKQLFGPDLRSIDDETLKQCGLVIADGSGIPSEGSPLNRAVFRGETVKGVELQCQKEGKERHFSVSAIPIQDSDSVPRVAVAIFSDISSLKAAEADTLQVNAELEQAVALRTRELIRSNEVLLSSNEELQRFAYIASHDLQTPLRTITGFAQILQKDYRDRLDEQADDYINRVVGATHHMSTLIRDLLAYTGLNAQTRPFIPVDFDDVFESVLSILAGPIQETGADVSRSNLPRVIGDRGQLTQVLQNLIENAIKYRGPESPKIRVTAERQRDEWLFSVQDNGIGIDTKHQEAVFEVFRRLHTQHAYPGTGIGLAVCRRVVERHGGRIWVEPTPGRGSVFSFTLPVAEEVIEHDRRASDMLPGKERTGP